MTKKEIKDFAKGSINPTFCVVFLIRKFFKGYENKSDNEILKEIENL